MEPPVSVPKAAIAIPALTAAALPPELPPGTLLLFYGRNYLHRVTPVRSKKPRILVTLNYNLEKGVELSLNARKTFFGRIK